MQEKPTHRYRRAIITMLIVILALLGVMSLPMWQGANVSAGSGKLTGDEVHGANSGLSIGTPGDEQPLPGKPALPAPEPQPQPDPEPQDIGWGPAPKTDAPTKPVLVQVRLPDAFTLHRGTTRALSAVTKDGGALPAAWVSSRPGVVSVDTSGNITALQKGSAVITAEAMGSRASCTVTVDAPITALSIDDNLLIHRGHGNRPTISVEPKDTTDDLANLRVWSGDTAIAELDSGGHIVGKSVGETTVTAGINGLTAVCAVRVDSPITDIGISSGRLTLHRGEEEKLTANAYPGDRTEAASYTWLSSDPKVVAVDMRGNITAVQKGKATITVSYRRYTAACTVTVDAPILGVKIDPATATIHRGQSLALQAIIDPVDNTEGAACTWESSDPKIATVDDKGKVTAVQKGSVTITVSCGKFKGKSEITVDAPILGVSIDPATATVHRGESAALRAVIDPVDTTGDTSCTWESSDTKIASVDANGKVTAKAIGKATITVTCGGFTATTAINVDAPILGVSIDPATATIHRNENLELHAVIYPVDTTESTACTWESSDTKIATVDDKGKVTAVQKGTVDITAATSQGLSAVCRLTVKDGYIIVAASDGHSTTTVSPSPVPQGQPVTVTCVPNAGYVFSAWVDEDGKEMSTASAYTFVPAQDMTLTAACAADNIEIGDSYEEFGGYDWVVVDKDANGNLTLMCKSPVARAAFTPSKEITDTYLAYNAATPTSFSAKNYWANSSIRTFLNSNSAEALGSSVNSSLSSQKGFLSRFTEEEQAQMLPHSTQTSLLNFQNYNIGAASNFITKETPATTDLVWLPSAANIYGIPQKTHFSANGESLALYAAAGVSAYNYDAKGNCTVGYADGPGLGSSYSWSAGSGANDAQFKLFGKLMNAYHPASLSEVNTMGGKLRSDMQKALNSPAVFWLSGTAPSAAPQGVNAGANVATYSNGTLTGTAATGTADIRPCVKIKAPASYVVTLQRTPSDKGIVYATPQDAVPVGRSVTVSCEPVEGYWLTAWLDEEGNTVSTDPVYKFTPTRDITLTAQLSPAPRLGDIVPNYGGYSWTAVNRDKYGNLTLLCRDIVGKSHYSPVKETFSTYQHIIDFNNWVSKDVEYRVGNDWTISRIRTFLNSDKAEPIGEADGGTDLGGKAGFLSAFSSEEQARIIPVMTGGGSSIFTNKPVSAGGETTLIIESGAIGKSEDRVWLPSPGNIYGDGDYTDIFCSNPGATNEIWKDWSVRLSAAVNYNQAFVYKSYNDKWFPGMCTAGWGNWANTYDWRSGVNDAQFALFQRFDNLSGTLQKNTEVAPAGRALRKDIASVWNGDSAEPGVCWLSYPSIRSTGVASAGMIVAQIDANGLLGTAVSADSSSLGIRPCIKIKGAAMS